MFKFDIYLEINGVISLLVSIPLYSSYVSMKL